MTSFFKDLNNFFKLHSKKYCSRICFFNENKFTFEYLKPYIKEKAKKHKILIFSFCELDENINNAKILVLKNNFFREFYFLTSKNKTIYSTTPDLNNSIFKTSKFQKNIYIYLQHSSVSLIHAYNKNAFINFDAIQAVNEFQFNDEKLIKKILKKKIRGFKSKYKIINKILKKSDKKETYDLMIAPSWSTGFYNKDFYTFVDKLIKFNIRFVLRPHPMSINKKELNINSLIKKGVIIDNDKIPNFSKTKNLVSDSSGVIFEFMFVKKRMPILIDGFEKNLSNEFKNEITFEKYVKNNLAINLDYKNLLNCDLNELLFSKSLEFNRSKFFKFFY